MSGFVARSVALVLGTEGVLPEGLCNTLFHNPADLAASGIVLYADGHVPEFLTVEELEALVCERAALILDVTVFGVVAFLGILHDGSCFSVR